MTITNERMPIFLLNHIPLWICQWPWPPADEVGNVTKWLAMAYVQLEREFKTCSRFWFCIPFLVKIPHTLELFCCWPRCFFQHHVTMTKTKLMNASIRCSRDQYSLRASEEQLNISLLSAIVPISVTCCGVSNTSTCQTDQTGVFPCWCRDFCFPSLLSPDWAWSHPAYAMNTDRHFSPTCNET
jgi:hypothetical protein